MQEKGGKKKTYDQRFNDTSRNVRKIKAAAIFTRSQFMRRKIYLLQRMPLLSFRFHLDPSNCPAHSLLEVKRNLVRRLGPSPTLLSVLSLSLVIPFSRPSPSVFPASFLSFHYALVRTMLVSFWISGYFVSGETLGNISPIFSRTRHPVAFVERWPENDAFRPWFQSRFQN